jgi:hypothetical protein
VDEQQALVRDARAAAQSMRRVASAPDASTYEREVSSSGLPAALHRVDQGYQNLLDALNGA